MDEGFPDTPPKGYFLTKIFHPNVSEKGEICVNTLKKDWKSELGIEHVLLVRGCERFANELVLMRYVDNQVLTDCAQPRVCIERGGGQVIVGAL